MTVTLSKNASTGARKAGQRRHRPFEILRLDRGAGARLGRIEGRDQGIFLYFGRVGKRLFSLFRRPGGSRGAIGEDPPCLPPRGPGLRRDDGITLLPEDVGGALVAGEEVGAFGSLDEGLEGPDPGEQPDEIVLAAEREDGVDQVVADPGFALLDLEAVGEEVEYRVRGRTLPR